MSTLPACSLLAEMMRAGELKFYDHLMRGLTHRMNNILSVFQCYLPLLLEETPPNSTLHDGLREVQQKADAAAELMQRFHVLGRRSSLVRRKIAVADFLNSMKPALRRELRNNVQLEIKMPDQKAFLWTNVSSLRLALLEIFRNAVEATPPGAKISIDVRLEQPDAGESSNQAAWISFNVTDHGSGISQEVSHRVFEPFFSTCHKREADGLGLSVAMTVAQQLGGKISFTSKPGETIFRILLPTRPGRA